MNAFNSVGRLPVKARHIDQPGWVYGYPILHDTTPVIVTSDGWDGVEFHESQIWLVKPDTICMATPFTDKNGFTVYEGDINEGGAIIVWDNVCGCWSFQHPGQTDMTPLFYRDNIAKLDIVGNIHNN